TGQRELIGEEAVETLGLGNDDAEGDGGHQGSAALASFARSCARPSSQSDTASAIAPTVMAESATLKVGQRALPIPTSTKSTTPRALRTRSITLPTAAAVPQNTRRSTTLAIFLLGLALDAEPRMGQRVEPLEQDVLPALLALTELLRRLIQPPQGLVDVPEIAALLRGEQERFLALHGVGALVRHVERVAREVAVRRLQARVEGLAVIAELLHHPGALLGQSLLG